MGLSKFILSLCVSILDALTFWVRPDPKRITFISLTQDKLSGDMLQIGEALEKQGKYDIRTNLFSYKPGLSGAFHYFCSSLRQVWDLKKSGLVIINDNNFVISTHPIKKAKVLQVWHACGAAKKFGNEIRRQYPVANYDAVLASSDFWKPVYAKSFGVREDQVYPTGLPRNDQLLDSERQARLQAAFRKKHPELAGKRLMLYAPTFRGNIVDGMRLVQFDFEKVMAAVPEDWVLLYKFHPLLKDQVSQAARTLDVTHEDLNMLMGISDAMISDYSSVIFDYALLDKPLIAYLPDEKEYAKTIGLNIDYSRFPGPVAHNENELTEAFTQIETVPHEALQDFQQTYIIHNDGKNTERVVKLIEKLLEA